MIGNLIASILRRYSTINNVVVARVIKSAIGGARHKISLDLSKIEPGLGGGGQCVSNATQYAPFEA
jgi:hypothetical protein